MLSSLPAQNRRIETCNLVQRERPYKILIGQLRNSPDDHVIDALYGSQFLWCVKVVVFAGFCIAFLVCAIPAASAQTGQIDGRVTKVRDVDTIVVAGTAVRLNGVDGPETSNRYGRDARAFMRRLVEGKRVTCNLNGTRTYDRRVGVCYLNGRDIGAIAISQGHALDCPRYSGGAYSSLETQAARSRLPRASYCHR